jgi:hypothetical protein
VAVASLDAALGVVALPFADRDNATLFPLTLIGPTDALPQPTQALVAAVQLTAAILLITGLVRRVPVSS